MYQVLHLLLPPLILASAGEVEECVAQQERVQHEVQERDDAPRERIAPDALAEFREQPPHLAVDAKHAEPGVDEHPLDFVTPEQRQVEDDVDGNRDPAVQVEKWQRGGACRVRHQEPRPAERQHMDDEERVDPVPGHVTALGVVPPVDADLALQFHRHLEQRATASSLGMDTSWRWVSRAQRSLPQPQLLRVVAVWGQAAPDDQARRASPVVGQSRSA